MIKFNILGGTYEIGNYPEAQPETESSQRVSNILKRTSKTDFWEMTLDHSVSFETKVVQFLESIWVPVTPSINLTGLYIKCRSRSPSGFALTREVKAVL